mgnify:CR=1 FL=1
MGATTIWERWNSIHPDGSFNPANMNSLNHYAYGSIGNWLYTKLCGLEILEPGYKKFALRPQVYQGHYPRRADIQECLRQNRHCVAVRGRQDHAEYHNTRQHHRRADSSRTDLRR